MHRIVFVFTVALTGCVTSSNRNSCFDFGVRQCVDAYARLTEAEQDTNAGHALWDEICQADTIRCFEAKRAEPFEVKLRMAKRGFSHLWLSKGAKNFKAIFQEVSADKSHQDYARNIILIERQIEECDKDEIPSCEKLLDRPWVETEFQMFSDVPSDASQRARKRICSNKNYRCFTLNQIGPYDAPQGWTILLNSTSTKLIKNKTESIREVVLKKSPQ